MDVDVDEREREEAERQRLHMGRRGKNQKGTGENKSFAVNCDDDDRAFRDVIDDLFDNVYMFHVYTYVQKVF